MSTRDYLAAVVVEPEDAEQSGVKGMKWGVHRADNARKTADRLQTHADKLSGKAERNTGKLGNGMTIRAAKNAQKDADRQQKFATKLQQKVEAKTAAKLDKKSSKEEDKARQEATKKAHDEWKKEAGGTEMANKVFQKAAKDFEKTAEIINNDANYKGKNVNGNDLLSRQYRATMNHYFNQHLAQASIDLTLNDKGRAYIYQFDGTHMRGVEHKMVLHDAMDDGFVPPDYLVELDDLGHAIGFSLETEFEHSGVKGMKWGVRKDKTPAGPQPGDTIKVHVTGTPPKVGAKVTSSHDNHAASHEVVKVEKNADGSHTTHLKLGESASQRYTRLLSEAKKQGANSLTDDDLKFVTNRGSALARVDMLNQRKPGWLAATAKAVMQETAKQQMSKVANNKANTYITNPLTNN